MRSFLVVFAVGAAVTYVVTPFVRRMALRSGAVDVPDDRKVHKEPTPTLGGVGLYVGFLCAMLAAWVLPSSSLRDLFRTSSEPAAVVVAVTIVVLLGIVDDLRGIKARTKLAGQLVAAGVLVLLGVQLVYFWFPFPGVGVLSLSPELSALWTVAWTIALINAVNLIDGLDGLAVGVTTIAAVCLFVYAYQTTPGQATTAELLTAIVAGLGVGFLKHNFNPASIFMGDVGSMMLGLLLASATVSGLSRTTEPRFIDVPGFIVPVLLPGLVLAIPLVDAGIAVLRRVRGGRPVFHPDKRHIHHWLLSMTRSHRQAVLVMYLWSAMLAGAALALALGPGVVWRFVSGFIALVFLASVIVVPRWVRRGRWLAVVEPERAGGAGDGKTR